MSQSNADPLYKFCLACRHNDKTVELTGHTGHFWLDFDKADDAQEWWTAMQSLNIAKNRSSFIPYVATDNNTEQKSKGTVLSRFFR